MDNRGIGNYKLQFPSELKQYRERAKVCLL